MNATQHTLDALYATGHWLMAQGRHRDALSVFRTMLLVDARDERGWLALAACHEELDEVEQAISLCQLAVSACGNKAGRCTLARARMLRASGSLDDAREAYEQAFLFAENTGDDELAQLIASEVRS